MKNYIPQNALFTIVMGLTKIHIYDSCKFVPLVVEIKLLTLKRQIIVFEIY